jgi:CBS domain-containing protein
VLLPQNLRAAVVGDAGSLAGIVTIEGIRKVEQDRWPTTPIDAVMAPASDVPAVEPGEPLTSALEKFGNLPLLPVMENGVLRGVLHRDAVQSYIRMREMLGFDARR